MSIEDIQAAYAEHADVSHRFEWFERRITGRYRRALFGGVAGLRPAGRRGSLGDVDGTVLDVACGTGTSFPYPSPTADLGGIDVSPATLAKGRDRLRTRSRQARQIDAQALDFEDDRFETVAPALSSCAFPDPVTALQEMERVCAGRADSPPRTRPERRAADREVPGVACGCTLPRPAAVGPRNPSTSSRRPASGSSGRGRHSS